MGFGNPYGEPWNYEIVEKWIDKLSELRLNNISFRYNRSAKKSDIRMIFTNLIPKYSELNLDLIFILSLINGLKKLILPINQDVKDLMVQFKVLAVVLWQKMN